MKKVYIAGPYSAGNILEVMDNIKNGQRMATRVALAGLAPFCPWWDYNLILQCRYSEQISLDFLREFSIEWLKVSDAMLILSEWENSGGTRMEIREAKNLNIPIFYSFDDLITWSIKK